MAKTKGKAAKAAETANETETKTKTATEAPEPAAPAPETLGEEGAVAQTPAPAADAGDAAVSAPAAKPTVPAGSVRVTVVKRFFYYRQRFWAVGEAVDMPAELAAKCRERGEVTY